LCSPQASPHMVRVPTHLTVSHLCLLLIVLFVIQANVERLAYSSIYIFKLPSSSVRHNFIDWVLNMGGSGEGDGSGTSNDAVSWSSYAMWYICVIKRWLCMYYCEDYMDCCDIYVWNCMWCICDLYKPYFGGSSSGEAAKIGVI
jgi:hypothetical protein